MSKIPIGRIGKIVAGDDVGKFVKIVDDATNTGGYLILISMDKTTSTGFDNWVASEKDLENFFKEAHWLIEWVDQPN